MMWMSLQAIEQIPTLKRSEKHGIINFTEVLYVLTYRKDIYECMLEL